VLGVDHLAGLFVDHLLAQAMTGASVDLMEMGLLGLSCGWEKLDRTGDQRKP
jgi:hypothetical protein